MASSDSGSATSAASQVTAWFLAVDRPKRGFIDAVQLQEALASSSLELSVQSAALMTRRFSHRRNGTLDLNEFQELHAFLSSVQTTFYVFDVDKDLLLDRRELDSALRKNGFVMDEVLLEAIFRAFDSTRRGALAVNEYIELAAFISATEDMFEAYDHSNYGRINIDFSQFVYAVVNSR